ncbi:hypothetical protein LSH36_188g09050 [Paralvinella palmiformis]|uniref:Protein SHQ1 homolog n=1 Tax=Paralvinella palmiformis TaxID=53620 RepID=A0AAD9JSW9_9ANNE|nr:hypothetical protein LSH36_188g09050 [Paralvinella palmiformis]
MTHKLDSVTTQKVFLSLVDIIFAYCYNHRTTEGDNTGESGWTIVKLSATLSWLQTYASLKEVVVSCYRRSLCFPLYRHWELAGKVYKDMCQIFTIGK